ncbi:hypothetical protein [Bradyrhizobium sp. Tv2a-2]|uniref:phage fiber-tail adaptor protein n=1 Tax=Bradyrhizobium sp. Tv2a-2 TaxID=113395 RepID=UPI0003FF5A0D|nr:hypothetical protein [Bradyrhizobium sp. Tv2a-2]
MLAWTEGKTPGEDRSFPLDWTVKLAGDTITTSTWAVIGGDAPAAGTLAINSSSHTNTGSTVVLSAGNVGILYTLANTITTAAGQTFVESVQLQVNSQLASAGLTTLDNALGYLGAANDDNGNIARLISVLSTQIENWLGYSLAQGSRTRTFNGQGTRRFFVPDLPLVSVQSLTVNGQTIQQGAWSGATQLPGFYNDARSIFLVGYEFRHGFQNISMTYTSGYSPIPFDVEQACLDWMKIVYSTAGSTPFGSNVIRVQAGDSSFDFGGDGSVTSTKTIPMPASVFAVLNNYRRVAMVSGF